MTLRSLQFVRSLVPITWQRSPKPFPLLCSLPGLDRLYQRGLCLFRFERKHLRPVSTQKLAPVAYRERLCDADGRPPVAPTYRFRHGKGLTGSRRMNRQYYPTRRWLGEK